MVYSKYFKAPQKGIFRFRDPEGSFLLFRVHFASLSGLGFRV